MNEKIKEFADAAGITFSAHWAHEGIDTSVITKCDLKEFAELIVRECAKFMDENSGYNDYNGCWFPEPEDMLKHFGIDE